MGVRAAVLGLQQATDMLQTRLQALTDLAQEAGGGDAHEVIDQVDVSAVEALASVEKVRDAANRAVALEATIGVVREALTEAQLALDKLQDAPARYFRGRALAADVADVAERRRRRVVADWAQETLPVLRGARAALRRVNAAMAACWREIAAAPRRVTVRTETVLE